AGVRSEIKFSLPFADLRKLQSILEVNFRRISFRNPTSRVASLYFDDPRLSACHDNIDGSPRRSKLRLRWYDAPFPEGDLFFEIKKRRGEATSKERVRLRTEARLDSVPFRELTRCLSRALPAASREAWLARPEAVVLVEYERRYYEAVSEPVRITLDSDLAFYSQMGRLRPGRRFPVRAPDLVILEAKTPVGVEDRIRELLHPLEPRATRSSKYVIGCQALGLLPGSHYGPI
ncbi:MAG: polyphosphate polymerase domain-containing protein, partial [Vicinamibacteria bacterium]